MPATAPPITPQAAEALTALGRAVRDTRKGLGLSAVSVAEAAGLSRPTLHRIEKGEASVSLGAVQQVLTVLGLSIACVPLAASRGAGASRAGWLPARIRSADYPWLRQLAWQLHGPQDLTPREALGIYERNMRHLDAVTLTPDEKDLIDALRLAFADPSEAEAGV